MPFACRLFGHEAMPGHYHNQGFEFSICAHCAADLIRPSGEDEWRLPPRGTRVVRRTTRRRSAAADVAARIGAPPPRRHPLRLRPAELPRPGPYRERPMRSGAQLVQLCGRLLLGSIARYCAACLRGSPRPRPTGRSIIVVPTRGQSRRARPKR